MSLKIKYPKLPKLLLNPLFIKRLKKTLLISLIICIAFAGIIFLIGQLYEKTVKNLIISEINKRLCTQIEVQDIEFSLFRKFPYASIHFINATAYDAVPDSVYQILKNKKSFSQQHINDSVLLKAEDVYLQFSILDILFSKYRIKKIEVNNADLNLKIFENGYDNYHIWKSSSDTTENEDFKFDLQKLLLKNVDIEYDDRQSHQNYRLVANNMVLKGQFSETQYQLYIDGDSYVYQIVSYNTEYLKSKQARLDITLTIDEENENIIFEEGGINFGNLAFDIIGNISYGNKKIELDITGKELSIQSFLNELPAFIQEYTDNYHGRGIMSFSANISGSYADRDFPAVSANMTIDNAELEHKNSNIALENVNLKAIYSNGKKHCNSSSSICINDFSAILNKGMLSGSIKIENFNNPLIELKAIAEIELSDMQKFIPSDTIQEMSGKIALDIYYKNTLNSSWSYTAKDFINSSCTGNMKLSDGNFSFKNNSLKLTSLNGSFEFNNNDIVAKNFTGNINTSDFNINGNFRNILSYIFLDNQPLSIDADFKSKFINVDDILLSESSSQDTIMRLEISDKINFNFNIDIRKLVFGKFQASNIEGQLKIRNRQVIANSISFNAMDGKLTASGLVDASKQDKLLISCNAKIQKANIRKMFQQLNNFGQEDLRDDNISGTLNASIEFASVWTNTFEADLSSVYVNSDISIENGELINYEPIKGLEKYFKARDFSHIKFSTLKTGILIKNEIINIPLTSINSDAVNLEVHGTHSFNNQIDYHLSMLLSELRTNKKPQTTEFGIIEDDGLHKEKYFFRITGTVEKPIYNKLDVEGYKQHINENLKKEKEVLKDILKKEFGDWFKKDSLKTKDIKSQENTDNQDFEFEWEEDND